MGKLYHEGKILWVFHMQGWQERQWQIPIQRKTMVLWQILPNKWTFTCFKLSEILMKSKMLPNISTWTLKLKKDYFEILSSKYFILQFPIQANTNMNEADIRAWKVSRQIICLGYLTWRALDLYSIKGREYIKQNQGKSGHPKQDSSGLRKTRKHSPSATMGVGSESDL